MGQRKARLAYAIREGKPVPPPIAPEMFDQELVTLKKDVSKLVTEEWDASPYRKDYTRAQYIALLVHAAANHERELRETKEASINLVVPATHLPPGMAAAAARLEKLKHGPR